MEAVAASSLLDRVLFYGAFQYKLLLMRKGVYKEPLLDKFIFSRIRQRLGGKVRIMATGSAPINPDVINFLRM